LTVPGSPSSYAASSDGRAATVLGVLGLVVGFLFCPIVGVLLGVFSIIQSKKADKPATLGIAAIVASVLGVVMGSVLLTVLRH
jgi:FtsH-binding integral membrane protein